MAFNCYYIPDANDRWFASPDFEVNSKEVPERAGGYGYGTRTKIRSLTQKVFFDDITIETREKIRAWLTEKSVGEQKQDERPFVVYRSVQLSKVVSGKMYATRYDAVGNNLYNGTLTVNFVIYEPYGYLLYKSYDNIDEDGAGAYCGILKTSEMPAAPTTSSRTFYLYNPGTETCDTLFNIGGTVGSSGLTISNETNGTKCKLLSLPSSGYLEIDSFHGAIAHVVGATKTLDFQNHDEGFLKLAPCELIKNVTMKTTSGSKVVTIYDYPVTAALIGKYIRLGSQWNKITAINNRNVTVENNASATENVTTKMGVLNKITVTGSNISLNKFEIDYYPMIV